VKVTSLGYRTDLMMRRLEGSEVTDYADHLVVRSPGHPGFWWGNFILLPQAPRPREAAGWLARFAEVLPDVQHVAIGVDAGDPAAAERSGLPEAGLQLERTTVLTAAAVHEPPHVNRAVEYRPLAGDADWQQSLDLRFAADDSGGAATRAFHEQRTADARRVSENGHGAWFGAFAGGRLAAQLGVFSDESGVARYQNVETDPDHRRNGLAGTLVWQAGQWAQAHLSAHTLVIVADPDAGAIRVYRSVGFLDAETQIAFQRPPYAVLQVSGAAKAGYGAAADPDGAGVVAGDVDPAAAAHGGALAGDVGGGGPAGIQQPAGQRRVQAAGHRVLAEAAEGGAERPHFEGFR
jgi:GNAT superfamily N-acetyltransferase